MSGRPPLLSSREMPSSSVGGGGRRSNYRWDARADPHRESKSGTKATSELKQLQDLLRRSSLTSEEEMANAPVAVNEDCEDNTSAKVAEVMSKKKLKNISGIY